MRILESHILVLVLTVRSCRTMLLTHDAFNSWGMPTAGSHGFRAAPCSRELALVYAPFCHGHTMLLTHIMTVSISSSSSCIAEAERKRERTSMAREDRRSQTFSAVLRAREEAARVQRERECFEAHMRLSRELSDCMNEREKVRECDLAYHLTRASHFVVVCDTSSTTSILLACAPGTRSDKT